MPLTNWEWVFNQLTENKTNKAVGDASINLLKAWEELKLNEKQAKQVVEIFSKLAVNTPLVVPVEENELWVPARPGAIKVGDVMLVKKDAYDNPELAPIHNGRRGKVVRISYGDIVLKYVDGKNPPVDGAHHAPHKLMKLVQDK